MKIRFSFLTGDVDWQDHGGKWISQKFNNGEFDWWFVREIFNWEETVGEAEAKDMGKYNVSLSVVAPDQVEDKDAILGSHGVENSWDSLEDAQKVEMAHAYGAKAHVFDDNGDNYQELFKRASEAALQSEFLFGFAMDRPQNRMGASGWDFLRGDPTGPKVVLLPYLKK